MTSFNRLEQILTLGALILTSRSFCQRVLLIKFKQDVPIEPKALYIVWYLNVTGIQ